VYSVCFGASALVVVLWLPRAHGSSLQTSPGTATAAYAATDSGAGRSSSVAAAKHWNRNLVTGTEVPDWFCPDAPFFRQFGACFENRRCSGRAKARPHYMLPSEISSGHGLQPVRFFMHLGARIAHEILSPNFRPTDARPTGHRCLAAC
jgi:hypothetical protein